MVSHYASPDLAGQLHCVRYPDSASPSIYVLIPFCVLPPGATIVAYKHCVEMPGIPPGEPANLGLQGSESGIWTLASPEPIDAKALLERLKSGKRR